MRPPPHPSSSSSHYSSFSEASQPGTSSQLPSLRAGLPPEAYSPTGRVHGEQRSDQHFQRFSTQSTSTRSTHPPSPSQSDATAYAHNRHSASMSSNEGTQQLSELRTGPSAPPPMLTGLPHHSTESRTYRLIIRQQPQQGRLCGLGSKDKRPLDPLPILQLRILKQDGTEDEDAENSPNLLTHVSLRKENPTTSTHSESVLIESNDFAFPWTRMLEGRLVASANVARDLDGSRACFFVFTDLSIRQEGQFRLAFKLMGLTPTSAGSGGQVVAEALTEPFQIYSPRRFPGMTESTELAKCLARQGLQVPVRNDIRRRGGEQLDSLTNTDGCDAGDGGEGDDR
ncbi:uncharacterized protein UBRO_06307 [Ustilago bromivora]|uniref:Velvet domain-containing protein n=1 Tax=Ustilago bromivora TaxID=307758 RepID=A0A1K0GU16_9BASI|nr:uncharacterized protein UBRO_06307 [Ustilago bromivora]SYW80355.1 uncharacterized protein UBRO2_03623 [Ustilago bromivora]